MRITNLDLGLGAGRTLQTSDLNYILDKSDVLCFQNGILPAVNGWESDSLNSLGIMWRDTLEGSYRHLGAFRKWFHISDLNDVVVISIDLPHKFSLKSIIRHVNKVRDTTGSPVVVCGDWSVLNQAEMTFLRVELNMAFVGIAPDGFFISDGQKLSSYEKIGVTYGNRGVVTLGVVID